MTTVFLSKAFARVFHNYFLVPAFASCSSKGKSEEVLLSELPLSISSSTE
jgi:hypothetical protein